jgi:hypothetical protein
VVGEYQTGNGPTCYDTTNIDVHITPSGNVNVSIKIVLQGPIDTISHHMSDDLRQRGLIPVQEPYTSLGFSHASSSYEQLNPFMLNQSGVNAIVDWVYVELRDSSNYSNVLSSRAALLQRDGDVVDTDGVSPVSFPGIQAGTYYVSIHHRNHLAVITAQPYAIGANTPFMDMTQPSFLFLGAIPTNIANGKQMMISGDANSDGQTQNDDIVSYWKHFVGTAGYLRADFDMDGEVQNDDRILQWRPNVGRGTQVPQ